MSTHESLNTSFVCNWEKCSYTDKLIIPFDRHVAGHISELKITTNEEGEDAYLCRWLNCGFSTQNTGEVKRHVKFHAYHTRLKAKGTEVIEKKKLPPCTYNIFESNVVPAQNTPFICLWDCCGEEEHGQQEFFDHVVKTHLIPLERNGGSFICRWADCKAGVPKREKLIQHVRSHTGERVVACPHCGHMFASNTKLANHCYRQLPIDGRSFQCNLCSAYYPTEQILNSHMRQHVHHYKCSFCDLTCGKPAAIARHIRYRHLDYRPFKCTSCPYSCKSHADLRSHIASSHSRKLCSDQNCECSVCFRRSSKQHARDQIKEVNKKIFSCHLCDKKYSRGVILTRHLLSVHNVSKPSGYSRFLYRYDEDGQHRLQTVRLESIEVTEDMENALYEKGSAALVSNDGDPDDPDSIEGPHETNYITIDVLDETGEVVKSETVRAGNTTLPPEATVVAVAP